MLRRVFSFFSFLFLHHSAPSVRRELRAGVIHEVERVRRRHAQLARPRQEREGAHALSGELQHGDGVGAQLLRRP